MTTTPLEPLTRRERRQLPTWDQMTRHDQSIALRFAYFETINLGRGRKARFTDNDLLVRLAATDQRRVRRFVRRVTGGHDALVKRLGKEYRHIEKLTVREG